MSNTFRSLFCPEFDALNLILISSFKDLRSVIYSKILHFFLGFDDAASQREQSEHVGCAPPLSERPKRRQTRPVIYGRATRRHRRTRLDAAAPWHRPGRRIETRVLRSVEHVLELE